VVRRVGRISGARPRVEAHFAGNRRAQSRFESLDLYHPSWILSQRRVPILLVSPSPNSPLERGAKMKSVWTRTICRLLMALMIRAPYHIAQAGMIGTDQAAT